MNRLAIHESVAAGMSPTDLVDLAERTGFDSVGLKVAHSPGAERWWGRGAGSPELRSMVNHLLTSRISVLDVGRVELGGDADDSYRTVLDLAERLGARHVTAAAGSGGIGPGWGQLVTDAEKYQVQPLLVPIAGTSVSTVADALSSTRMFGGAIVLSVSTSQSAFDTETQVLESGSRLGYLRLQADELDAATETTVAGLLSTVPVHIPIAVGGSRPDTGDVDRPNLDPADRDTADLDTRARRWRQLIDRMLEHPLARARRLGREQPTT